LYIADYSTMRSLKCEQQNNKTIQIFDYIVHSSHDFSFKKKVN